MIISREMTPVPSEFGTKYSLNANGTHVVLTHVELDFGVVINIGEVRGPEFTNFSGKEDPNLIGLITCLSGSIDTDVGNSHYTQIPGTAIFGQPSNKRTHMIFPGERYRGIAIGFRPILDIPRIGNDPDNRYMLAMLKERFSENGVRPFKLPIELIMVIDAILVELENNGIENKEYLRRRSAEVLHLLYCMPEPIYPDIPTTKNLAILDRLCAELTDDLSTVPNIKQLCEDNELNEFWFIRNFKKRFGYTPYEYHKVARHTRAAAMMISSSYQISDVAKMTGYSSQSKFSMAFREIYGCRPKHFPKQFESMLEDYELLEDLED